MSVYSELLRMALEEEDGKADGRSVDELVTAVTERRSGLYRGLDTAARLADSIAYDVALVHLCEKLSVSHELSGTRAGPEARRRAEQSLVEHLPSLANLLRQDSTAKG